MNPGESLSRDRSLSRALIYNSWFLQICQSSELNLRFTKSSKHKIPLRIPNTLGSQFVTCVHWHIRMFPIIIPKSDFSIRFNQSRKIIQNGSTTARRCRRRLSIEPRRCVSYRKSNRRSPSWELHSRSHAQESLVWSFRRDSRNHPSTRIYRRGKKDHVVQCRGSQFHESNSKTRRKACGNRRSRREQRRLHPRSWI